MLSRKEQELLAALEQADPQKEIEILTLEIVGGKKSPTIRVYIDAPEGVSFEELAQSQAWMGSLMDKIDPFPGAYTLEVSSPGIDRPLRTAQHFQRFAGKNCVVKLKERIDNRSSIEGVIVEANEQAVVLCVEDKNITIPFSTIKKANLRGSVDFKRKD